MADTDTVTKAEAELAAHIFYRLAERDAGDAEPWVRWNDLTDEERAEWREELLSLMEWKVAK